MEVKIFEHNRMEKHSFFIKLLRIFTVPILNIIPSAILKKTIITTSTYGKRVIERPGSSHSLENMYIKNTINSKKKSSFADSFWHNIVSQPKAVRNRLKIVELKLEEEIDNLSKLTKKIKIYNIGGGSSRAIIKVVSKYHEGSDLQISVTTVDRDSRALQLGKEMALENHVEHLFTWIEGDARDLQNLVESNSGDIIEMVGLLDYFDHEQSINLIKQIYNSLKPSGAFLVANVFPNSESKFVENVGWPKMHYKTTEEMTIILVKAGFVRENITLHIEPLKVHIVGVARK